MTLFVRFFPASGYLGPQTLQNKGKRKMTNRSCGALGGGGPKICSVINVVLSAIDSGIGSRKGT